jgi:P-type conjugative transfer protein TrbJ
MSVFLRRLTIITSVSVLGAGCACAGTMTGGATLPEQIVQEMTQTMQLTKQAEQVSNQLMMLENEARNLASLPTNFSSQMSGQLSQLTQIIGQANGLSFAGQNITSQFQQQYPGYVSGNSFGQQYQTWFNNSQQSTQAALQAQHLNAQDFATQNSALSSITAASQTATGRMQVLQAGNQIAAMQVKSLQHLETINSANSDAQLAYRQQQNEVQNASKQAAVQYLYGGSITGQNTPAPKAGVPSNIQK